MKGVVNAGTSIAIISLSGAAKVCRPRDGIFETLSFHALAEGSGHNPLAGRIAAAEMAAQAGTQWMIALAPGEALAEEALELAAPALDSHDAIFGAARLEGMEKGVLRLTRLAFDAPERLPHALLNWWMPQAHFVRTDTARRVLEKIARTASGNWFLDYLFELWASARCMKSAQPLIVLDREPLPVGAGEREYIVRHLAQHQVFLPIVHGDKDYLLPYTGQNAGIEREQSRGLFFEAAELEELRKVVPRGAHIVDVGANTGNHTVFFAGPMQAACVTPFEPLPGAIAALKATVSRNGLNNVDLSKLGFGVSDRAGRARLAFSTRGGLGATSLTPDPQGEIGVATLDSMVSGPVDFLKIDVEGMEMSVLAGAERMIRRSKPLIFIEIANANTMAFVAWLSQAQYRVLRIFTDKGHANYLIAPKEPK